MLQAESCNKCLKSLDGRTKGLCEVGKVQSGTRWAAWVLFLTESLLHISATAGIVTQLKMAAPLGETQLPFAGVFCSPGTDVTSSPGYVVKRGKKQDAKQCF